MSALRQNRQPAGIPVGGQFAAGSQARAQISLDGAPSVDARPALDIPAVRAARRQQLLAAGYVPPRSTETASDPKRAGSPEQWWDYEFRAAEYGHAEGDYPQMPDDNTPGMHGGHSLSGHRRTHRMNYEGNGVALRMPSATAVKRFAASSPRKTFDVPFSATHPGGSQQGWVRVTQGGDGDWHVEPLGFSDSLSAAYVCESVASVLEARRPSRALKQTGDILAKFRDRMHTTGGAALEKPPSTWISGMGYDRANETLVMTTGGRKYGYSVPPQTFAALRSTSEVGKVYNRLVKNQAPRVPVAQCGRCHRYYNEAAGGHRCAVKPAERDGTHSIQNARARSRATDVS